MGNLEIVPRKYLLSFCLVTILFALWGFANNFTVPLVKVFKDVCAISNAQSSVVQMAFYGGYATMAVPAALCIRKFSYRVGIIVGLSLFAAGAMLSIGKTETADLDILPFLKAESRDSKNDEGVRAYVESRSAEMTTVDGAITDFRSGIVASYQGRSFKEIQKHDLNLVSTTYMNPGLVVLFVLVIFIIRKTPSPGGEENDHSLDFKDTVHRLFGNPRYLWGVVAPMFYVGAQIMVWTFVFHYAEAIGMDTATAGNH